jgi:hypothetical protein
MNTKQVLAAVLLVVVSATLVLVWNHLEYSSATQHETDRWAVLQDVEGTLLSVEPTSDEVWAQLVHLNANGSRMWVGGVVQRYTNKWGFRFAPETIIVAQVTIEGAQATIRYISDNLEYWLNFGIAYVGAIVLDIHEP